MNSLYESYLTVIGIMKQWMRFFEENGLLQLNTFIHLALLITGVILVTLSYVSWKKYSAMKKRQKKRHY
ncbi:MAG TPA: sporulation protein YpjB [Pseudogracilibacillus sp.]|nr:sporulation protein YpjB [Pseudogracilibacillus sp.]